MQRIAREARDEYRAQGFTKAHARRLAWQARQGAAGRGRVMSGAEGIPVLPAGEAMSMASPVFVDGGFYQPSRYKLADGPIGKLEWLKVGDVVVWRAGDKMPVIMSGDDDETKRWKRTVLECHGLWPDAAAEVLEQHGVSSQEEARRREARNLTLEESASSARAIGAAMVSAAKDAAETGEVRRGRPPLIHRPRYPGKRSPSPLLPVLRLARLERRYRRAMLALKICGVALAFCIALLAKIWGAAS